MGFGWDKFGKKAYAGIKKYGMSATIIATTEGTYDVETGKTVDIEVEYDTHAIIKNYSSEDKVIVNPEDVEIIFHSGATPDTIPNLMNIGNLKIKANGTIYKIITLNVIRPATITMMYKARATEASDA